MTNLKHIKHIWTYFQDQVNQLIDAINIRSIKVSDGGGLDIQESPNGFLLSLSAGPGAQSGGKAQGTGLTQLQIDTLAALVAPPSSPVSGTFYPFTSSGEVQPEGWLGVTTVDPSTCATTIVSVWSANPTGIGGGGGL